MKKIVTASLTLVGLSLSLQGCFFVAGAAAGAAAIAVVKDHRPIQATIDDTKIQNYIMGKNYRTPVLNKESHVEVTVFNGIVLLTGETPNPAWKQIAEENARSAPGVGRIYNQLTIQGPTSSLTRTSDGWITTKVKSQMLTVDGLKSSSIKVVTEDGVVYLMGVVNRDQADTAVDIARQVDGVQKVIKIFQYVN